MRDRPTALPALVLLAGPLLLLHARPAPAACCYFAAKDNRAVEGPTASGRPGPRTTT